jgi:hypothetical protein
MKKKQLMAQILTLRTLLFKFIRNSVISSVGNSDSVLFMQFYLNYMAIPVILLPNILISVIL